MKTQEILLASTLLALVAGAGAALATRAFQETPERTEREPRPARESAAADPTRTSDALRRLDELSMQNASLSERLAALETRLAEALSTRTPLAPLPQAPLVDPGVHLSGDEPAEDGIALEVTPAFVASVGRALEKIRAGEEAEREARRKELQAVRIEERVAKLQQELGLSNRQASELRTALIDQDDRREALFASLREGQVDPRDVRESFRVLRDETHATIRGFLTSEQFIAFQESEESELGRRGFGDFGPPGPRPPEDGRRPGR